MHEEPALAEMKPPLHKGSISMSSSFLIYLLNSLHNDNTFYLLGRNEW